MGAMLQEGNLLEASGVDGTKPSCCQGTANHLLRSEQRPSAVGFLGSLAGGHVKEASMVEADLYPICSNGGPVGAMLQEGNLLEASGVDGTKSSSRQSTADHLLRSEQRLSAVGFLRSLAGGHAKGA